MSKPNNSQVSFKDLQGNIDNFKRKRDELNKKTKEYINNLQEIENQIYTLLKTARDVYKRKRDSWNKKVKALKNKKIEYKNLLENLIEEKRKIYKNKKDNGSPKRFISIKQIDRKIENLERIIDTESLNIHEENEIVDKIKELAETKQEQLVVQQNNGIYLLERKIEIVKINLNKIYEQLIKWSNKSQDYHAKMHELYQKANKLKDHKIKMEEDLIENKKAADRYHIQFLELMNHRKKISRGKRNKSRNRKRRPPRQRAYTNKNQELFKKMLQDKLAIAIEKQKAGKKLNLYEARLILEQSKK